MEEVTNNGTDNAINRKRLIDKVLYVERKDALYDERLEKEVKTLVDAGIDVSVLLLFRKDIDSHFTLDRLNERVKIYKIPYKTAVYRIFNNFISILKSIKLVSNADIVYVIATPDDIVIPYYIISRIFKKKIFFEVQDTWYPAAQTFLGEKRKFGQVRLKIIKFKEKISHKIANKCDEIVTTSKEMKTYLVNNGINQDKITIVNNRGDLELLKASENEINKLRQKLKIGDKKVLSYMGTIQVLRGLDILVESIKIVSINRADFKVVIVGDTDNQVGKNIQNQIKENDLDDFFILTGWQDNKLMPAFFNLTDIGVIPHKDTYLTQQGVANKFFNYMLLKKCLIHSDLPPVREYYTGNDFILFKPDDPGDLAKKIDHALDRYKDFENNIQDIDKYEWEGNKFIKLFEL